MKMNIFQAFEVLQIVEPIKGQQSRQDVLTL